MRRPRASFDLVAVLVGAAFATAAALIAARARRGILLRAGPEARALQPAAPEQLEIDARDRPATPRSALAVQRSRDSFDLAAVVACAALAAAAAFVAIPEWASLVLGLLLIFLLPGYAVSCALLSPGTLTRTERFAYSSALSIAASILTGIAVQLIFALDRKVWMISLAALTVTAACGALISRRGLPVPQRGRPPRPKPVTVVTVGLAAALVVAAIVIGSAGARDARSRSHFTELSILPATSARAGHQPVVVAVENRTGALGRYRLEVSQKGHRLLTRSLVLQDGARSVQRVFAVTPTPVNPITATLLRAGHVHWRVFLRSGRVR